MDKHPLVNEWRASAARDSSWDDEFLNGAAQGLTHAAKTLDALLTTVYTTPPSVAQFRAHEAKHGPWLRVRGPRWLICRAAVVNGQIDVTWPGSGGRYPLSGFAEFQWSDEMGHVVPPPEVSDG